ncbi:MAG: alkaline ceramidase, partial [Pseudomonadota bacterium]
MIRAGVAVVDITPPKGLLMAGFAARTEPAEGAHDRLTVRALAIEETVLVVADIIGFHHEMSARVRA